MDDLETKVMELHEELGATQEQLLRLRADMDLKDNELRQKSDELKTLSNKVKVHIRPALGACFVSLTLRMTASEMRMGMGVYQCTHSNAYQKQ